jgi:hypothetical protein
MDMDAKDYTPYQEATCAKCGCDFREIYEYARTEVIPEDEG